MHSYRVVVHAHDAAEVICGVGGWLSDQAMAGWNVSVVLADPCQAQALGILGVRAWEVDPGAATRHGLETVGADVLVISARMHQEHCGTRELVGTTMARGDTAVLMWGGLPTGGSGIEVSVHAVRPSAAAAAFKTQALRIVRMSSLGSGGEDLYLLRWPPSLQQQLGGEQRRVRCRSSLVTPLSPQRRKRS